MTIQQRNEAEEGRGYWIEYTRINGYAFYPTQEGLEKLARNLDLEISYIRRKITKYLEA